VLQRIRVVFDWCKAQGYCSGDNPTDGLTKVLPKHRSSRGHHAALPYPRIPSFIRELRESAASEPVKLALEFTILCATRTSETLNATWDEIDFDAKTWTIPGERMKAGVEHRVPLTPRAIEILERAKSLSNGGPYVFPGRVVKLPLSNMVFLMTLRRMNRDDVTAHGFRSSFRDWAVGERERATLLTIIAALARSAGIDVSKPGTAGATIEGLTIDLGARVARRTVIHHLNRIPDALERRKTEQD
jgi:integrase